MQLFQRHIPSHKYKYDHTMRLNYYKQPFGFGLQTAFIDHLKTALIKLILFFALALFYTNIKKLCHYWYALRLSFVFKMWLLFDFKPDVFRITSIKAQK